MVKLHTNFGDITLDLDAEKAPKTVANFLKYAEKGFYDGTIFHRVIDGFMAQGGDGGNRNGTGGSTKPNLKQEFSKEPHVRGVCSMARSESAMRSRTSSARFRPSRFPMPCSAAW